MPLTFSSQVNQPLLRHDHPPEQLLIVPAMLTKCRTSFFDFGSKSSVVQPPVPFASYFRPAGPGVGNGALMAVTSWLRIRRIVRPGPSNTAMPSWRAGMTPPAKVSPVLLNVTYLNPRGSARMWFPSWSGVGCSSP